MRVTAKVNIELAKPANYIPMGFWVKPVMGDTTKPFYHITDLGIPMVKVADGTALGYSVYVLQVDMSNDVVPSVTNPQWRLVESAELIYIQQAFIERLWVQMLVAEGAEIGGFEIKNGLLQSKAKDDNDIPLIVLNGNTGQAEITGKFSSGVSGNRIVIDPVKKEIEMLNAAGEPTMSIYFNDSGSIDYSQIRLRSILNGVFTRTGTFDSDGVTFSDSQYNFFAQFLSGLMQIIDQNNPNKKFAVQTDNGQSFLSVTMSGLTTNPALINSGQVYRDTSGNLKVKL